MGATDKRLNRDVAIKRLKRDSFIATPPEKLDALLQEGRNTARLKGHRNIVEVHEVFQEGSDGYIVMEYVDGTSLDTVFKQHALHGTWLATDEALDILRQTLEGLVFAHSSAFIHRDIKPSNILVSKLGVVKLVDFGIAKPMRFSPPPGTPAVPGFAGTGSQPYMSFEQTRGEELDQRSDIFSAGIVGYLLLTGKHPFNHPSAAFSIFDLIKDHSFPCTEIPQRPDLPEGVRKAVMKMLLKDKALRYQSVFEPLGELIRGNSLVCSQCAAQNAVGSNFCNQCGTQFKEGAAAKPPAKPGQVETAEALTDAGFELTKSDDWEGAIVKYEAAIKVNPSYGRAISNLGYALNRFGQYEKAIGILTKGIAVTSNPNVLHRLYDTLGFAQSNIKDFKAAVSSFTSAIELNPNNPRVFYHRAESEAQAADYFPMESEEREAKLRGCLLGRQSSARTGSQLLSRTQTESSIGEAQ
ncbi:MAG: protein kinase domain-containing protein [Terriglobia bacterium]